MLILVSRISCSGMSASQPEVGLGAVGKKTKTTRVPSASSSRSSDVKKPTASIPRRGYSASTVWRSELRLTKTASVSWRADP
jgi:hypothetical protein